MAGHQQGDAGIEQFRLRKLVAFGLGGRELRSADLRPGWRCFSLISSPR